MKKSDYRNMMNKVKCSSELRSKMEEKLSAPQVEYHEYDERVTHLERAPRFNIGRIVATASAVVLVVGAVGFAGAVYYSATRITPDHASEVNVESSDDFLHEMPFSELKVNKLYLNVYASISDINANFIEEDMQEENIDMLFDYFDKLDWVESEIPEKELYEENIWVEFRWNIMSDEPLPYYMFHMYDDGAVKFIKYDWDSENFDYYESAAYSYQFDLTDYENIMGIFKHNYKPTVEEEVIDSEVFAELIDSAFPDGYAVGFRSSDGQVSPTTILFNFTEQDKLREKIKSNVWVESPDSFEYRNFYIIGNLLMNEEGMLTVNNTTYRLADESKTSELFDDILTAFQADEVAWLRRRLCSGLDSFNKLEADVCVACRVIDEDNSEHLFEGYGKIYRDNDENKTYIYADEGNVTDLENDALPDINQHVDFVNEGFEVYFAETNKDTGEIIYESEYNWNYSDDYVYIDYFHLYYDLVSMLGWFDGYTGEKFFAATPDPESGDITYNISYANYEGTPMKRIAIRLTPEGRIVCSSITIGEEEKKVYRIFNLINYKFDSDDFEMPDVSIESVKNKSR